MLVRGATLAFSLNLVEEVKKAGILAESDTSYTNVGLSVDTLGNTLEVLIVYIIA